MALLSPQRRATSDSVNRSSGCWRELSTATDRSAPGAGGHCSLAAARRSPVSLCRAALPSALAGRSIPWPASVSRPVPALTLRVVAQDRYSCQLPRDPPPLDAGVYVARRPAPRAGGPRRGGRRSRRRHRRRRDGPRPVRAVRSRGRGPRLPCAGPCSPAAASSRPAARGLFKLAAVYGSRRASVTSTSPQRRQLAGAVPGAAGALRRRRDPPGKPRRGLRRATHRRP